MRDDFAQLLIDTYRVGGSFGYKRLRRSNKQADQENLPRKEGVIKPYGWEKKGFGDNTHCLLRYLEKQVGRPWSKIHSEIVRALKTGKGSAAAKRHVMQHVDGYVTLHVVVEDGRVYDRDGRYFRRLYEVDGLYVDLNGILRENTPKKRRGYYRGVASEVISIDNTRGYERHDNKWYYVEYEKVPKVGEVHQRPKAIHDVFLGEGHVHKFEEFIPDGVSLSKVYGKIGQRARYAVFKRRASDKEASEARKLYG